MVKRPRQKLYRGTDKGRYTQGKANAKYRNLSWNLTFAEYHELIEDNQCVYCHGPFPQSGAALDRKDNTLGYIPGNCVPCCAICNAIKGANLSYEEMYLAMAVVRALRELS